MNRRSIARRAFVAAAGVTALIVVAVGVYVSLPRAGATGATATPTPPSAAEPSSAASTRPEATSGPAAPDVMTEEQAVSAAREFLSEADREAEVWRSMQGTYAEVDARLGHRPPYLEQPDSVDVAGERVVWGVEFRVDVEICGPSGGECQTRVGLRTIFLDAASGEWLRSSTFAPSPADELPR